MELAKTLFIDVDGCIFKHRGSLNDMLTSKPELLPGVREKFNEWIMKGYQLIIATGRPESAREVTHKQLTEAGLFYHQLIMNCSIGERWVINDTKPSNFGRPEPMRTAFGCPVERDKGLQHIVI